MISSLHPSRPQAKQHPAQSPLHQQQRRSTHTEAQQQALMTRPRSQIEAMPPSKALALPEPPRSPPLYNPALVHPVFFTSNWRKPPFPIPMNNGLSPAAMGYVFPKPNTASGTKL